MPGKGSFVAPRAEADTLRREQLLKELDETVRELQYLGVTRAELAARIGKGEDDIC